MIVEFSVALLDKLQLTPNEFFIVTLIKHKEFDLLTQFLGSTYTREESGSIFSKLIDKKYLTSTSYLQNYYDYSRCKLGNELYSLLKTDDIFEEFLEAYPISVIRPDGVVDYLRVDQKGCKMMYIKLTRNSIAAHQHILKCLEFEVEKRRRDGSIKYMVHMSKWLTTEAWKSYEDEINTSVNTIKYGTELE
jgi:hypothetical protein